MKRGLEVHLWEIDLSDYRYTARFVPQAWVKDYAVDIDPAGEQTWNATEAVLAMPEDYRESLIEAMEDGEALDLDDWLKDDPNAPDWVRTHSGPFSIWLSRQALRPWVLIEQNEGYVVEYRTSEDDEVFVYFVDYDEVGESATYAHERLEDATRHRLAGDGPPAEVWEQVEKDIKDVIERRDPQ